MTSFQRACSGLMIAGITCFEKRATMTNGLTLPHAFIVAEGFVALAGMLATAACLLEDLAENPAHGTAWLSDSQDGGQRRGDVIHGNALRIGAWPDARSVENHRHVRIVAIRRAV